MRDIIISKEFYIPLLIGTILISLWIYLNNEYDFFKQEWMFDLYFVSTIIIAVTVAAFLLGQI